MVKYRPSREGDIPFIVDSWAQSFFAAPAVKGMTRDDYFPQMHSLIVRVLSRRAARVMVACDAEDDDTILGWACIEGDVCHYVFVRHGASILVDVKQLYGSEIRYYTHKTREIQPEDGWAYQPFLAWNVQS